MSSTVPRRSRGLLVALLALGPAPGTRRRAGRLVAGRDRLAGGPRDLRRHGPDGEVGLDHEQVANAATIAAVAHRRELPVARGDRRARDGDAGVRAVQPHRWRPRQRGALPAAALTGLGLVRRGHRPDLRLRALLLGTGLRRPLAAPPRDGRRAGGAAQRLPGRLPEARRRGEGDLGGPDRTRGRRPHLHRARRVREACRSSDRQASPRARCGCAPPSRPPRARRASAASHPGA